MRFCNWRGDRPASNHWEIQLSHNALSGEDDTQFLQELWDERLYSGLDSEELGLKEVTGRNDGPVKVSSRLELSRLGVEELAQYRELLVKASNSHEKNG